MPTLSNPASNTSDAAGDTYISIENLRGSSFNDTLVGNAGNNRLDGGLGLDRTIYTAATGAIHVDMAAGTVSGPGVGNDTLISVEFGPRQRLCRYLCRHGLRGSERSWQHADDLQRI